MVNSFFFTQNKKTQKFFENFNKKNLGYATKILKSIFFRYCIIFKNMTIPSDFAVDDPDDGSFAREPPLFLLDLTFDITQA